MTEGNFQSGSTRRLQWLPTPVPVGATIGGMSLVDDLTRDLNLRALVVATPDYVHPDVTIFYPMYDGIINTDLKDVDDFQYVTEGLRGALGYVPALSPP